MLYHVEDVIREADLSPVDFPKTSRLPVTIYDRKNQEMNEPLRFQHKLFVNNPDSQEALARLLSHMEAHLPTTQLFASIDANAVCLWCSDFNKKYRFSRLSPLNMEEFTMLYMS